MKSCCVLLQLFAVLALSFLTLCTQLSSESPGSRFFRQLSEREEVLSPPEQENSRPNRVVTSFLPMGIVAGCINKRDMAIVMKQREELKEKARREKIRVTLPGLKPYRFDRKEYRIKIEDIKESQKWTAMLISYQGQNSDAFEKVITALSGKSNISFVPKFSLTEHGPKIYWLLVRFYNEPILFREKRAKERLSDYRRLKEEYLEEQENMEILDKASLLRLCKRDELIVIENPDLIKRIFDEEKRCHITCSDGESDEECENLAYCYDPECGDDFIDSNDLDVFDRNSFRHFSGSLDNNSSLNPIKMFF